MSTHAVNTQQWKVSSKVTVALTESPAGFTHPIAPAALVSTSAQPTNELMIFHIITTPTGQWHSAFPSLDSLDEPDCDHTVTRQ